MRGGRLQRSAAHLVIALILFSIIISSIQSGNVSSASDVPKVPIVFPASAVTVPRNEMVWGSGYWPSPTSFCPYLLDSGQGWDTYLMYEPMFGTNVANGSLMKWLGESITPDNATNPKVWTITLRNGIKWNDGTNITSADVKFTFQLYEQQAVLMFSDLVTRIGHINSNSFEIVNDRTFKIHVLPAYYGSYQVYRRLVYGFLIVPKSAWTLINATYYDKTYHQIMSFANDWNSTSFPAAWKVASGMYLPYWHDTVTTIIQRNDNWWGINVFGHGPAPKYFGYTSMSNPQVVYNLQQGNLDWDGHYVAGLDMIKQAYPFLHTYYTSRPYFPDGSAVLLVPNNMVYPLNQSWLHKAISHVLGYDAFSALSSGYLKKPSPLLIPADDAIARELLNSTIEAKYNITYGASYGLAILNQYCFQSNDVDGNLRWWTKALGPGGKHYPLAKWDQATNKTSAWTIIDINGWTDVDTIDLYAADSISADLGIPVVSLLLDWGSYTGSKWFGNSTSPPTFDFADYIMELGFNSNMYERYTQFFTGPQGVWNHYGNYTNSTLTTLLGQLDTVPYLSAAQHAIANQIQEIIGQEMPIIPLAGHPTWYIYSTKYWLGWADNATNKILPPGPFGGGANEAQIHAILLGLKSTGDLTPPETISDLATSSPTIGSINLTWTAPGDDGMSGNATRYMVKYSSIGEITDANWYLATNYTQSWTPVKNGTMETHVVTGLSPATTYWFAIKACDEVSNYGGVSNSPSGTTLTGGTSMVTVLMVIVLIVAVVAVVVVAVVLFVRKSRFSKGFA